MSRGLFVNMLLPRLNIILRTFIDISQIISSSSDFNKQVLSYILLPPLQIEARSVVTDITVIDFATDPHLVIF